MKKFFLVSALLPILAFAQADASSSPATTTPDVLPVAPVEAPVVSTTSPQEGTTSQETIPSNLLEGADNPQSGGSATTSDTVSTTTPIAAPPETSVPTPEASTTPDVVGIVTPADDTVAAMPATELEVKKDYVFALSGASIAAKGNPDWTQSVEDQATTTAVDEANVVDAPALDTSAPSTLSVSGACADPYYVILLYKNAEDYDNNPSSYIYNRAFPCTGGWYSYSISDLPFNMESGTFYLLVAGQGSKGSWKPISALVPVGITVTTTTVSAPTDASSTNGTTP